MRLAWRNLSHDRLRFAVTVIGIVFAVFLMVFQGSLLVGFINAASRLIDASDADIWIVARGVPCFEYPAPLPQRFRELAQGVPGVAAVSRVVVGATSWQSPSGGRQLVVLVGAEAGAGRDFPLPRLHADGETMLPEAVLIDQSNAATLESAVTPVEVEINRRRARVERAVTGFGSFLGSPYVFAAYADAVNYLGLGSEETMYLLVRTAPGYEVETVRRDLQARLPEADVWTRNGFASRSRTFWLDQTGSGGAISLAGLLGFLVGLVVVSQTIYSTTMDHLEEFATLKAIGASGRYVLGVVLTQALASGVAGSIIGIAVTIPLLRLARRGIAWIYTPWWLLAGMVLVSLVMCGLASLISIRKAVTVEPGRVFRA
ncbi:MAG: ABC transporter permease [Acidobacteriota bacterium]